MEIWKNFSNLPPFAPDTTNVRNTLIDLGKKCGIMDAKDDLTQPPTDLINNLA